MREKQEYLKHKDMEMQSLENDIRDLIDRIESLDITEQNDLWNEVQKMKASISSIERDFQQLKEAGLEDWEPQRIKLRDHMIKLRREINSTKIKVK